MMNCKFCLIPAILALAIGFSPGADAASLDTEIAPQEGVELCVAKIRDNMDLSDAFRVHHDIESTQRRAIGHVLKIETQVYGQADSEAIRQYATICKVGIGNKPVKFRIAELDAGK